MELIYSRKALLFIDGNLRSLCASAFLREEYDVDTTPVETMETLRSALTSGTLQQTMTSHLLALIGRKGIPSCIAIAFPSRLGLPPESDPDGSLILKSLLASCVTIGLDPVYAHARFHFFILTKGEERLKLINECPEKLFNLIKIESEDVRFRIESIVNDKSLLSHLFLFKAVDTDRIYSDPHLMVKGFLQQIDARFHLEKKVPKLSAPIVTTKNDAPANVVFRSEKNVWLDGKYFDTAEIADGLELYQFHIVGSLTTKNIKAVIESIKKGIKEGISDAVFQIDDEIMITLDERCTIDATAATALAQLLVTDLARYKKKKIIVSSANDGIMRRSQGYTMIREFVRVARY